jgi:hypothetical protein
MLVELYEQSAGFSDTLLAPSHIFTSGDMYPVLNISPPQIDPIWQERPSEDLDILQPPSYVKLRRVLGKKTYVFTKRRWKVTCTFDSLQFFYNIQDRDGIEEDCRILESMGIVPTIIIGGQEPYRVESIYNKLLEKFESPEEIARLIKSDFSVPTKYHWLFKDRGDNIWY